MEKNEEIHIEQIQEDIKLLMSFVPASDPNDVVQGLCPTFYFTGTYQGDLALVKRIHEIKQRYGITEDINCLIDDHCS